MPKPNPNANWRPFILLPPFTGERARPANGYIEVSAILREEKKIFIFFIFLDLSAWLTTEPTRR